jgi:hypothetical protein
MNRIIDLLLASKESSIRYKVLVNVLDHDKKSREILKLQEEIKNSPRVKAMLMKRIGDKLTEHPYCKWHGAHWVLSILADIGYPEGDKDLIPLREQVYKWLFSEKHIENILLIKDRARIHASMEGNAIYYLHALGLADDRTEELAKRLLKFQWADGGWNCDRHPNAAISSYHESITPMRGLAIHAKMTNSKKVKEAVKQCSEIFLKRRLFKKLKDGNIIKPSFIQTHYPCYWHYDFLFGLKVLAEAGFIHDKRCSDALDLLESKRLPNGGFPAEAKYYYKVGDKPIASGSPVNWGGASKKRMNEFVTVDALYVLKAAGRLKI